MFGKVKTFVFFVLILFSFRDSLCQRNIQEQLPKTLPSTGLYDLRGREISLEKLEGNVLLIHFWATWCTSCADEMKTLNKLQKLVRKEPIIIIPISEDFKGAETVKAFYNKSNLKFLPAFIDKNNRWFKEMKVSSLPATFIIDSQGRNVMSMGEKVDWLDEKNINLIRRYISSKQPFNQDYVSLLDEHSVVDDKPNPKIKHDDNGKKAAFLRAIETNLSTNVDKNKLEQGEIGMANPSKNNFTERRPVNLDINGGE